MTDTTELTREEVEKIAGADPHASNAEAYRQRRTLARQLLAAMDDNARLRADLDRAAADENASTAEAEALRAELAEARAALAALRGVVLDTVAAYGGGSLHEWTSCPFCSADGGRDDTMGDIPHDADCPWRLEHDRKADTALTTMEPPDAD